jgi:hypothetical protein
MGCIGHQLLGKYDGRCAALRLSVSGKNTKVGLGQHPATMYVVIAPFF